MKEKLVITLGTLLLGSFVVLCLTALAPYDQCFAVVRTRYYCIYSGTFVDLSTPGSDKSNLSDLIGPFSDGSYLGVNNDGTGIVFNSDPVNSISMQDALDIANGVINAGGWSYGGDPTNFANPSDYTDASNNDTSQDSTGAEYE